MGYCSAILMLLSLALSLFPSLSHPLTRSLKVLLAIDDSESMQHNKSGQMACEALAMIAKSLSQLEVGDIGILKFGEDVELLHPFDRPFTSHAGPMVCPFLWF